VSHSEPNPVQHQHFAEPKSQEHDLGFALPQPAKPTGKTAVFIILLLVAVVAAGYFIGFAPRRQQSAALARATKQASEAVPTVAVIHPKSVQSTQPIMLTATLQPLADTVIYPRANGYVQSWSVDIGAHVKAGQVLAVIETPELDQQLDQAKAELLRRNAALGQAQAQSEYAKTSLARYERLRPAGVASQQELDQKHAEARVQEANVTAAAANIEVGKADIRRLQQLKSFARVTAPFAGVITQRNIDVGSLVQPGNTTPLFRVADTDTLRAFLAVPQDLAPHVKLGSHADVRVREYPERTFAGTITHTAGALDQTTRTLLTEVRIDNRDQKLLSGMYVEASLSIARAHEVFEVPATTLYNDAHGLRVAIVDDAGTLHFRKIALERDAGATLLIASGLQASDRLVKLADASLAEGAKVRVRTSADADAKTK
jgi:RND family efflux transporter MFP subunit